MPTGIQPPDLIALTPAIIEVKWSKPLGPNGIITMYTIERKLARGSDFEVIATFGPEEETLTFVDQGGDLLRFTTYSYSVKVLNGAGTGIGPWANVTTSSASKNIVFIYKRELYFFYLSSTLFIFFR